MSISTSDVSVGTTAGLTDAELRATPIDVNATFAPSGTQDVNIVSTIAVPVTDNGGSLTVDGSVSISGSVAVTGPLTDTQLRATPVTVNQSLASSSTVTLVTTTGSNLTLLAANPNRKKVILFCEASTQYIKLGATASSTSYTYKVATNSTTIEITGWAGIIDSTGTSGKNILVTELS